MGGVGGMVGEDRRAMNQGGGNTRVQGISQGASTRAVMVRGPSGYMLGELERYNMFADVQAVRERKEARTTPRLWSPEP